jgi:hypothetical protein
MLKLIALTTLLSTSAFAGMTNLDIPSESQWAKGMTKMACKVKLGKGTIGSIEESEEGVVYTVMNSQGEVVAAASATSTFILAKKECLTK